MVLAQAATSARSLAGMALALAMAGCAAGENLDGSFGAQDTGVATGNAAGISNAATPALTVGTGANAVTYSCPSVTVRTGAGVWQVSDSAGLRYQGNVGQLARECAIAGQTMTVKVGIEGRVILGEKGTPGTVNVPIRVAVVEEGPTPKTITTKFFKVPVQVPPGQSQASYTVIEDQVAFPLLKPEDIERYVIYVGYDSQGEKPQPAVQRPRRTKPAAKPAAEADEPDAAPAASPKPATSTKPARGAPSGDVFGPPPSGPTSTSGSSSGTSSSGGGFTSPPSGSAFDPPPN